jgi:hypothetical protein
LEVLRSSLFPILDWSFPQRHLAADALLIASSVDAPHLLFPQSIMDPRICTKEEVGMRYTEE